MNSELAKTILKFYLSTSQTRAVMQVANAPKKFLKHAGIMKRKRMKVTNCLILFL
jgi:hypothetical protein